MYAIIPAAGQGSRLGKASTGRSKVFLQISSHQSILELTLRSIAQAGVCKGMVVAARSSDRDQVFAILGKVVPVMESLVVCGGETRQESVYHCLQSVEGKANWILVHDAARPFCPPELIKKVSQEGQNTGAAILAVTLTPTLKFATADKHIIKTVPRENLWAAQTPQVFAYDLLRRAHLKAQEDGYRATDDSELVERLGAFVRLVEGTEMNLKITTESDLELARVMYSQHQWGS